MSRIVALLYPVALGALRLIPRTMIVRRAGIRKPDYVGSWHIASFRCDATARRLSGQSGLS
jgi:hypothetical protein